MCAHPKERESEDSSPRFALSKLEASHLTSQGLIAQCESRQAPQGCYERGRGLHVSICGSYVPFVATRTGPSGGLFSQHSEMLDVPVESLREVYVQLHQEVRGPRDRYEAFWGTTLTTLIKKQQKVLSENRERSVFFAVSLSPAYAST